ncbi:MAG: hypothetical protein HY847_10665 [Betaproteobacteria bacterium]|nr:hypothetical protein [Betaproteobacteria bacterium]
MMCASRAIALFAAHRRAARRLAVLLLFMLPALVQAAQLGRLFLTPERRAQLERQRQLNIQEKTQETIEVASVHVNGMVRRSGGKTTVWVNGRPQREGVNVSGISVRPSSRRIEEVEIGVGEETPASLRVGERLNRATQELSNGLAGGRLQINRGDETKRPRR